MIKINDLSVNGKSTADFPFLVYVEENDGFRFPKKKNQLIETEYTTGATKNTVVAWAAIPKGYTLYCPTATLKDMRQIKLWAADYGRLIAADEPDVFYEILDVEIGHRQIDAITGYRIKVIFTVQPFGYEHNQPTNAYTDGETLVNHTNAPMYPRITIYGDTANQTSIKIGEQEVFIKRIDEKLTIENKPLEQNVFDNQGREINNVLLGDFFEIPADSESLVTLGNGITRIEILERWAWL